MEEDLITPVPDQEPEQPFIPETVQTVDAPVAETPEPKKKTYLPWLNLAVLAGLVVLYVLFFVHATHPHKEPKIPEAALFKKEGGLTIAFINSDSLKAHYQLVKDLQQKLEGKFSKLNADISGKQTALESRAGELQRKYENKQISMDEAQRMDEQLKAEGKKIYDLNQQYSDQMATEEGRLNQIYIDSINNFLARYNKKYSFDYILGYSKGGGILYARDTLDITKYVLEGLNDEYYQKFPESKKKSK
ncbi:MAG: OmpH family outer membrane protein [Bacteroidetes bacterium]|nr:OmpH family outer membrane protein [Bacteroidota bacterium]